MTFDEFTNKLVGREHFCKKKTWSVALNIIALILTAACAEFKTVFCHPSLWAAIVFVYCLIFYLSTYIIDKKRTQILWGLSSGLFVSVFSYLLCFTLKSDGATILLCFIGGFFFYFYAIHLMGRIIFECFSNGTWKTRLFFFIPIIASVAVMLISGAKFRESAERIENTDTNNYETLPKDFMTEHIVGMHFKYYSKICLFDGWRPPVHEPILVIGLWQNGMKDPLRHLSLEERLDLYKKLFPNKPYKMDCGCENGGWPGYDNDELWK